MTRSEHERVTDELLRLTKQHNQLVDSRRASMAEETVQRVIGRYPMRPPVKTLRYRNPRLLVIGHGGHGKDTVAGIIVREFGLSFTSSSEFAAQRAVYPLVRDIYPDWQAAYADRRNHRELWYHAIRAYNLRPGPSLAAQILAEHDMYLGMRSRAEFDRSAHLFDAVIWVDAKDRLPVEDSASMKLTMDDAEYVIDNNGTLSDLHYRTFETMQAVLDDFADTLVAEAKG